MRILVIEDSPPTRELLRRSLEGEGHTVVSSARATTGLRLAAEEAFELIILDVMLPDGDGLELCRALRERGVTVPILFLTAKGDVGDRIRGLDAGGDDYLRKPFALAELYARVRALGRRQGGSPLAQIRHAGVRLDLGARRFERDGVDVPLTRREWAVLEVLATRPGRLVTRQEILDAAWPESGTAGSDSLDVIVSRLRRKLGPHAAGSWVRTVRGEGYVFEVGG